MAPKISILLWFSIFVSEEIRRIFKFQPRKFYFRSPPSFPFNCYSHHIVRIKNLPDPPCCHYSYLSSPNLLFCGIPLKILEISSLAEGMERRLIFRLVWNHETFSYQYPTGSNRWGECKKKKSYVEVEGISIINFVVKSLSYRIKKLFFNFKLIFCSHLSRIFVENFSWRHSTNFLF